MPITRSIAGSLLAGLLLLVLSFTANATVWVVNNTLDFGVGSLRNSILQAAPHDTIRFNPALIGSGNINIPLGSEIPIDKPLTIIGLYTNTDSLFINGLGSTRIFNVDLTTATSQKLILDSLIFRDGFVAGDGDVIYAEGLDTLVISNSTFEDCATLASVVYVEPNAFSFTRISNSIFKNNGSNDNIAAFYLLASHDTSHVTIEVDNSVFADHTGRGMDIWQLDPVNSTATTMGQLDLTVSNTDFLRNAATNWFSGDGAGFHYLSGIDSGSVNISVSNCLFEENSAHDKGSGFLLDLLSVHLSSLNLHVDSMTATNNSGDEGVIYIRLDEADQVDLKMLNSSIINNNDKGFAAWLDHPDTLNFEVLNCILDSNYQGILVETNGPVPAGNMLFENSSFTGHDQSSQSPTLSGGGLRLQAGLPAVFKDCYLAGNQGGSTGGILTSGDLQLRNTEVINNLNTGIRCGSIELLDHSIVSYNQGGGIYSNRPDSLYVLISDSSEISHNMGGNGGIFITGEDPQGPVQTNVYVHIEDGATISYNETNSLQAHGLYIEGGTYNFQDNTADSVYVTITNARIVGNVDTLPNSTGGGGGTSIGTGSYGEVFIDSTVIDSNIAGGGGGGLSLGGNHCLATISNSQFSNNIAANGPGGGLLASVGTGKLTLINTNIEHDSSSYQAAGLYAQGALEVIGCTISHNRVQAQQSTTYYGGGVYCDNGPAKFKNSVINNNYLQTGFGGGIYGLIDSVINCQIKHNVLEGTLNPLFNGGGGGGLGTNSLHMAVIDSEIDSNSATGSGGGLHGSTFTILNSSISGNFTYREGGAIYCTGFPTVPNNGSVTKLVIAESVIDSNEALGNGGGIWINGVWTNPNDSLLVKAETQIARSTISGNKAGKSGGAFYSRIVPAFNSLEPDSITQIEAQSTLTLQRSTVSNNEASEYGGGIYVEIRRPTKRVENSAFLSAMVEARTSTISHNTALLDGGGIYAVADTILFNLGITLNSNAEVYLTNSTLIENSAGGTGGGVFVDAPDTNWALQPVATVEATSTIVALNSPEDIRNNYTPQVSSQGYNIFGSNPTGTQSTDQLQVNASQLSLGPLQINGGLTPTHLPSTQSIATNNGNPADGSAAQNGPISGTRDVGAAEGSGCGNTFAYNAITCNTYTWPFNGVTYDSTTTDSVFFTNAAGCDSIILLNVVVGSPEITQDTVVACNAYFWSANSTAYTTSGTYEAISTNTLGCDSGSVLHLTINESQETIENQTSCGGYFWPITGITYSNSGTYSAVFTGQNGCDSTLRLSLQVDNLNAYVQATPSLLTAFPANATSYQWYNCDSAFAPVIGATSQTYSPPVDGNYAVVVTRGVCTDTTDCVSSVITSVANGLSEPAAPQLFPNPTTGPVTIQWPVTQSAVRVTVSDATGRTLQEQQFRQVQTIPLDLNNWATGVYYIQLTNPEQSTVFRVIRR